MPKIRFSKLLLASVFLPLLLIAAFAATQFLPRYFVDDPQYDCLFWEGNYSVVTPEVIDGKVFLRWNSDLAVLVSEVRLPKIYRYHAASKKLEQLVISVPKIYASQTLPKPRTVDSAHPFTVMNIVGDQLSVAKLDPPAAPSDVPGNAPIAELQQLTLSTERIAPDGYEFTSTIMANGPYFLPIPSASAPRSRSVSLRYRGNIQTIFKSTENYYEPLNFLGWVMP